MIIALFLAKAPTFRQRLDRVDWSGSAFCVGILSSIATAVVASGFMPWLSVLPSIVAILAVGVTAGLAFASWRGRITRRREAESVAEIHAIREQETQKQLVAARASGAFDRWQAHKV